MPDRPTREPTDLERRLHEALRTHAVSLLDWVKRRPAAGSYSVYECQECWAKWIDDAERHAPDCLARPDALGDER